MNTRVEIDATQIELLRRAVIAWDPNYAGAPVVGAYGTNTDDLYLDIAPVLGIEPDRRDDPDPKARIEAALRTMGDTYAIALQTGVLAPGNYRFRNLIPQAFAGTPLPVSQTALQRLPYAHAEVVEFQLTAELLALIRRLNAGWLAYYGLPGVDAKRPYGLSGDHQWEMAKLLDGFAGEPDELEPTRRNALERLHQSTQPAVQVLYSTLPYRQVVGAMTAPKMEGTTCSRKRRKMTSTLLIPSACLCGKWGSFPITFRFFEFSRFLKKTLMYPDKTALLLIGYQNDYFAEQGVLHNLIEPASHFDTVLSNTLQLLKEVVSMPTLIVSTPIIFTSDYSELHRCSGFFCLNFIGLYLVFLKVAKTLLTS